MSFDLDASLRRRKPQRRARIRERSDQELQFVTAPVTAGPELLLDTCVYIDVLQGRAPPEVGALMRLRPTNHSSVCLSELTHLFGRLDPAHPGTDKTLDALARGIKSVPSHRLWTPGLRACAEAGMLAGLATRTASRLHDVQLLNDALLILQALDNGWVVVTRNIGDFDALQQLAPGARILFYRTKPRAI